MDAKHPEEVDDAVGTCKRSCLPRHCDVRVSLAARQDPRFVVWQADVCFADQCSVVHCEYLSTWSEGHYVDGLRAGHCRDRVMNDRRRDCRVRLLDVKAAAGQAPVVMHIYWS